MLTIGGERYVMLQVKDARNLPSVLSSLTNDHHGFVAHIIPLNNRLRLGVYGCDTEKLVYQIEFADVKEFISKIRKIFSSNIKSVILQVFDFKDRKYPDNFKFCLELKQKFEACKVPYYFLSNMNCIIEKALTATNITVNIGESVMLIYSDDEWGRTFQYTKDGYEIVQSFTPEILRKIDETVLRILANHSNLKKIIVSTGKNQQRFMDLFKSYYPILIDLTSPEYDGKCLIEIHKWILDKSYTKFHAIPTTPRIYFVTFQIGETDCNLILVPPDIKLPVKASCNCLRSCYNHSIGYHQNEKLVKYETFKLTEEAHEFKITLNVDIDCIPSYEVEGIVHDYIVNFPKFCDSYQFDGIDLRTYAIIGILANRSFLCVNKNGKFEFLETWGGQWGKPMHICFNNKKPEFGKVAEEIIAKYERSGVQDLLQVMAEGVDAVTTISPHGYTFTKDEQNPVLLQFATPDGQMMASPEFLFAMLLKEHFKDIKKETGEKPISLGFCIFNVFTEKENKNIQNALEKACDLMKIKNRCFIPWK